MQAARRVQGVHRVAAAGGLARGVRPPPQRRHHLLDQHGRRDPLHHRQHSAQGLGRRRRRDARVGRVQAVRRHAGEVAGGLCAARGEGGARQDGHSAAAEHLPEAGGGPHAAGYWRGQVDAQGSQAGYRRHYYHERELDRCAQ